MAKVVSVFVLMQLLLLYDAFAAGFVISKLWLWHVTPFGWGAVGWPRFAAFCLVVAILRRRIPRDNDTLQNDERLIYTLAYYCTPWLCLAAGWVYR